MILSVLFDLHRLPFSDFQILYTVLASFCRIQRRKKCWFAKSCRIVSKTDGEARRTGVPAPKNFCRKISFHRSPRSRTNKSGAGRSNSFEPVPRRFSFVFVRRPAAPKAPAHRPSPDSAAARPSFAAGNHTGTLLCNGRCSTSRASVSVRPRPHPCGGTDLPARP